MVAGHSWLQFRYFFLNRIRSIESTRTIKTPKKMYNIILKDDMLKTPARQTYTWRMDEGYFMQENMPLYLQIYI